MKKIILITLSIQIFVLPVFSKVNVQALFNQGMEAFNSENYGSSELLFRKIIDVDDENDYNDISSFYLARSIYEQKKYKSAIFEFNNYINKCRRTSLCNESHFWIAESYYNLSENNKAIDEYKRFLKNVKNIIMISSARDKIGNIYYSQKRYDEAVIEWNIALSNCTDKNSNALRVLRIGEALFKNQFFDKSLKRLSPLLTSHANKNIIAGARSIVGRIYQHKNEHRKAIKIFKGIPTHLLKKYPFYETKYYLAKSYIAIGKINKAKSQLEIFIAIGENSDQYFYALYELGEILVNGKFAKQGILLLEKVKAETKKNIIKIKATKLLGSLYIQNDPEKAVAYLKDIIHLKIPDEEKDVILILGKAYLLSGDYVNAKKMLDRFEKKYPYDTDSLEKIKFLKARIYLRMGKIDLAMDYFGNIEKENPFSEYINESKYYLAHLNYRKEKYSKSKKLLLKYLRIKKIENKSGAYSLIVKCYLKLKKYRKAEKNIKIIIKKYYKSKKAVSILYFFGIDLYNKKYRLKKIGEKYLKILMKRSPESREAYELYYLFANDNYKKNKFKKAIPLYEKYLAGSIKENKGRAYYNRLMLLYKIKKFEKIIIILDNEEIPPLDEVQWKELPLLIIRTDFNLKNYAKIFYTMQLIGLKKYSEKDIYLYLQSSLKLKKTDKAINALSLISKDKKILVNSNFKIAEYLYSLEDYENALKYYLKVIENSIDKKMKEISLLNVSKIYIKQKKYNNAEKSLKLITKKSFYNEKMSVLILVYLNQNDKKGFKLLKKFKKKLIKNSYGEPVFYKAVNCFYKNNDFKKFKIYAKYLKKYKKYNAELLYMKSELYYNDNQFKKAYYYFSKLIENDSKFKNLSIFRLAELNLFINNKKDLSIKYFLDLLLDKKIDNDLKNKASLHLAIIYYEMNDYHKSRKYLIDLKRSKDVKYSIKAKNLFNYYKFK